MNSQELGQYITATQSYSKPWILLQLRLKKLQEAKADLTPEEFEFRLADLHQELMNLGEWWVGREAEEFGSKFTDTP
jgi:hypothetical protein